MERHDIPFGGFDIFLFGDFRQLPPVGARAMYASGKDIDKAQHIWDSTRAKIKEGLAAYYTIDQVLTLRINERQKVKSEEDETPEQVTKRKQRQRRAHQFRRHLDRLGNGTCSGDRTDIDPFTGYSDTKWWRKNMLTKEKDITAWTKDDRVVTLVHTNQEALNISARYAIQKTDADSDKKLWQWPAENTCVQSI